VELRLFPGLTSHRAVACARRASWQRTNYRLEYGPSQARNIAFAAALARGLDSSISVSSSGLPWSLLRAFVESSISPTQAQRRQDQPRALRCLKRHLAPPRADSRMRSWRSGCPSPPAARVGKLLLVSPHRPRRARTPPSRCAGARRNNLVWLACLRSLCLAVARRLDAECCRGGTWAGSLLSSLKGQRAAEHPLENAVVPAGAG
jgi:hypothetical protein